MFIGDPFATGVTLDPDFHLREFAHVREKNGEKRTNLIAAINNSKYRFHYRASLNQTM